MNMAEQAPLPDQEKQGHTHTLRNIILLGVGTLIGLALFMRLHTASAYVRETEAVPVYPLPSRFLFWLDGVPQFVYVSSHRLRDWDVTTDRLNVFEYREKEDA